MSAIIGRIEFGDRPISETSFEVAAARIDHYGQTTGRLGDELAMLAARVLPVANDRPADTGTAEQGRFSIVADVILDNRNDLCAALAIEPAEARETTDTKLILLSFLKWGEDCVYQLEGDFAFAVWDRTERVLFLARDHIGARPLYWRRYQGSLVFSSDIRALRGFDDLDWSIDTDIVAAYLKNASRPLPKPFFRDLFTVPPGETVTFDHAHSKSVTWWNPRALDTVRLGSEEEYVAQYRALTERAIAAAVATDFPVGAHFSGGFDSTTVTVLAQQALRDQDRSLRAAYPWSPAISEAHPDMGPGDERRRISRIAEKHGFDCHFGTGEIPDAAAYFDRHLELDGTADLIDEYPVLQKAGQDGIRVMLSGWGGDEAFSSHGFGYLAWLLRNLRLGQAFDVTRRYAGGLRNPKGMAKAIWDQGIRPMLPDRIYAHVSPYPDYFPRHGFANPDFLAQAEPDKYTNHPEARWRPDPIAYARDMIARGHLSARTETWAAWSAPHGFQYRYPLLNRRLLEFILGLPPDILQGNGRSRYLLRRAFDDILPRSLTKSDPANERLRTTFRETAYASLAEQASAGAFDAPCPWLDLPALKTRLEEVGTRGNEYTPQDINEIGAAVLIYGMYQRAAG